VCAIESLANLSEEAGGGGGGLPGAQENAGGDADLDGDLVPYFARVRSVEACPEQPDSQLGLSAISGSLRTCGTACLMYGECLGFSWRESALSCTLLRGACERSGNGAAQLYSKRSATPAPIEVVLSGYCDDDFTWVREVDCAAAVVFLYTKCDREDPLQNIPPGLPLCVRVELLSNIGREGGTFLHHLHAHQERFRSPSASGALVLLQGEVEWHAGQLDVLEYASQWASAGFGFAPLSFAGCSDRGPFVYGGCGWDCHQKRAMQTQNMFSFLTRQNQSRSSWITGFRGQMLVSKQRAARVPPWLLRYNLELLGSEQTGKSMYGHALERLWSVLFGCWAPAEGSTTLASFPACLDGCDAAAGCGPNQPVPWEGLPAPLGAREWIDAMLAPANMSLPLTPPPCTTTSLQSEGYKPRWALPGFRCGPLFPGWNISEGHGVCARHW